MKVYVLVENYFNHDGEIGDNFSVLGVFDSFEKAEKEREKEIEHNIKDFGFVRDVQRTAESEIIFWDYVENWNNYIEYIIEEREVL